ncbi:MAG: DUF1611 domain-containing protein [Calditrichaeota bacterium]|nr:MAG: DUF1611 domain-containing protein [Calditrichota bacterium]
MKRRIVIHADRPLKLTQSKSERDLIRYLSNEIIGVIDPKNAGKTTGQVLECGGDIPITSSFEELIEQKPNYLLIGASGFRGEFPMEWYPMVIKALQMRVHILNGLHQSLNDVVEFELLSKKYKARIYDLRNPGEKPIKFKNTVDNMQSRRIFIGALNPLGVELPAMMQMLRALHKQGVSADWVPTGLASTLIKGKGFVAESMIADLISGHLENHLLEMDQNFRYIFIEGQGCLKDPMRAGAFVNLLHGARPNGVVLTAGLEKNRGTDEILASVIDFKRVLRSVKKAPLLGLALATYGLKDAEREEVFNVLNEALEIPVFDPFAVIPDNVLTQVKTIA